jgi:hypothetical protein
VHDRLYAIELVKDLLGLVEGFTCTVEILRFETELDAGDFDGGIDIGILRIGLVDPLR